MTRLRSLLADRGVVLAVFVVCVLLRGLALAAAYRSPLPLSGAVATGERPVLKHLKGQPPEATWYPDPAIKGLPWPAQAGGPLHSASAGLTQRLGRALGEERAVFPMRLLSLIAACLTIVVLMSILAAWPHAATRRAAGWLVASVALHPAFLVASGTASAGAFAALGVAGGLWLMLRRSAGELGRGTFLGLLALDAFLLLPTADAVVLFAALAALALARRGEHPRRDTAVPWPAIVGLLLLARPVITDLLRRLLPTVAARDLPAFGLPMTPTLVALGDVLRGLFGVHDTRNQLLGPDTWVLAAFALLAGLLMIGLAARAAWPAADRAIRAVPARPDGQVLVACGVAFAGLWLVAGAPGSIVFSPMLSPTGSAPGLPGATLSPFLMSVAPWLAKIGVVGLLLVAIRSGVLGAVWRPAADWLARRGDLELAALGIALYVGLGRVPAGLGGWEWLALPVSLGLVDAALSRWLTEGAVTAGRRVAIIVLGVYSALTLALLGMPGLGNAWGWPKAKPLLDLGPGAAVALMLALAATATLMLVGTVSAEAPQLEETS